MEDVNKKNMQTLSFWYGKLPFDVRLKANTNTPLEKRLMRAPNISNAVAQGFDWISSPEGEDYWNAIFMFYKVRGL